MANYEITGGEYMRGTGRQVRTQKRMQEVQQQRMLTSSILWLVGVQYGNQIGFHQRLFWEGGHDTPVKDEILGDGVVAGKLRLGIMR